MTTAVLMVALGLFLYQVSVDQLNTQINQKGVLATKNFADFADPIFWFNRSVCGIKQLSTE